MPDGVQQYVKLENRLVLLAWVNHLFGYESNRDLLQDTKNVAEASERMAAVFSTTTWWPAAAR